MIEDLLVQFRDLLARHGLQFVTGRYYSIYRAEVVDTADPDGNGRVKVLCPSVSRTKPLDWAYPISLMGSKNRGLFFPPDKGDFVKVMFEEGDTRFPIYLGGWWGDGEVPAAMNVEKGKAPVVRGIRTPGGHELVFDDTPGHEKVTVKSKTGQQLVMDSATGAEQLTAAWTDGAETSFLVMNKDGVFVSNQKGSQISMDVATKSVSVVDENGNSMTLDTEGIKGVDKNGNVMGLINGQASLMTSGDAVITAQTVNIKAGSIYLGEGANASAVMGEAYHKMFLRHQHGTSMGLSTPPVEQTPAEMVLSRTVKLRG